MQVHLTLFLSDITKYKYNKICIYLTKHLYQLNFNIFS